SFPYLGHYFYPPCMEEVLAYLNSIYHISEEAINYIMENLKEIEIPKKEFILKEGRICYNIYFVKKGLLRCYYIKDDKEISAWFMKETDIIFSVESFLNQVPSRENIQAIEDCTLYFIEYAELQYLYHQCAEFNFVGRVLTEKYYQLSEERLYS